MLKAMICALMGCWDMEIGGRCSSPCGGGISNRKSKILPEDTNPLRDRPKLEGISSKLVCLVFVDILCPDFRPLIGVIISNQRRQSDVVLF